jgi:DNA-binding transcriptional LysR family regulator
MSMDRLHAMEVFVRVIETGSFSAAARDLHIGQPAVSKVISSLEATLGVRLLVRSTHRLSPTDAGQAYYERVRLVVRDADEAHAQVRGLGLGLEGRLRVCAPVTFARLHVAPKLGPFLETHPKLRLELVMDDRNVDLLSENIDVALRLGALADSALTARKLSEADRMVVASPAYVARRGTPRRPSELANHDVIAYSRDVAGERWRFRKRDAEVDIQVESRLSFTAAEGVRAAVLAGLGLAITSRWMMAPELASGDVQQVLRDWTCPSVSLWAVFPAGRLPTAKARAFVSWFEASLATSW